ncbi:MAG TPA: VOC family protein, partial [Acidimicrobiales bacterium]|nr:VOC family protein [Acidimicrobiales bacterium]
DLDRSVGFYTAVGYEVVGRVPESDLGHLVMLKLPGDEFVSIELVFDRNETRLGVSPRLSHFVIQVESIDTMVTKLALLGINAEVPVSPDGSDDFLITWMVDPDGNRIELVQWPAGHRDGMTAADFANGPD